MKKRSHEDTQRDQSRNGAEEPLFIRVFRVLRGRKEQEPRNTRSTRIKT